ncbi:MAG: RtcB family protein [Bacteroidota bacterium]
MGQDLASSLQQLDAYRYLLPRSSRAGMRTEGLVFADEHLILQIRNDKTLEQVANVATLPGLVGPSLAMPDAHQGYGFCIGGVAAADIHRGVVCAGGVGFDINCGVRLIGTPLGASGSADLIGRLLDRLFREIPCGAGRKSPLEVTSRELGEVLRGGARWAVERGHGEPEDLDRTEENGRMEGADPGTLSARALDRGRHQIGTLGSGNHFLEFQRVETTYDRPAAEAFGLRPDQVVVLLHSGSRGLGHQVCTDHLELMQEGMRRHGITVVDRQLACVPVGSKEGEAYLGAMAAAANFAFANRQIMTFRVREAFRSVAGLAGLRVVYDVCHNIAKREEHEWGGSRRTVLVHRKGATRALPAGHPLLPADYRTVGHPVLIPGSMGSASYVLVGTPEAMHQTFGSCCHGAGRSLSRTQARRGASPDRLLAEMKQKGILVRGETKAGLLEEKPDAYKDVDRVVEAVQGAGIARKVARLVPLAVMKG